MHSTHALAFAYGRSALYSFFKAMEIENAEVIIPAYTCVVVPHAIVMSGNIPVFVDINLSDYNMNLEQLEKAISPRTRAIIPTHLFGYPMDTERVNEIVAKTGRNIFIIQDCAHSFDAEYKGKNVANQGDAAIFGVEIGKFMSAVYGGMMTTNDDSIYEKLKQYRDKHFSHPRLLKQARKLAFMTTVYIGFENSMYEFVNFIERNSSFLDKFTKYYRENKIDFPKDFNLLMGDLEARVGQVQLDKYEWIKQKRRTIAEFYNTQLQEIEGLELPPIVEGATYSHYALRVKNRNQIIHEMRKKGVQLGQLIEYSVPHMAAYRNYANKDYPNSLLCSKTTINLPCYPNLRDKDLLSITNNLKEVLKKI